MSTEALILSGRAVSYRDYSPEDRAAVIEAIENNGGNVLATAKLFGIPQDTVYYWWQNSERFSQIQKASAFTLADKLESIAFDYAESLQAHDRSIIPAKDKASILGTVIDRMQLLRGQATSISASVNSPDEQKQRLNSLFARLEAQAVDAQLSQSDQSSS